MLCVATYKSVFAAHHPHDPPLPVHGGTPNLLAADGIHASPYLPEQRFNNNKQRKSS